MLLTIDLGNTAIGVAVFSHDKIVFVNKLMTPDYVSKRFIETLVTKEYLTQIKHVIVSSVVPIADTSLAMNLESLFSVKPIFIDHSLDLGITIKIDYPEQLGADIIAGVVGSLCFFPPPLMVIDSGTATTFGVLKENFDYVGGVIFPGLETSIKSLANNAAKLEKIQFKIPQNFIGTNTTDCINAGIYFTTVGGMNLLISEYKKIIGNHTKVVTTGGLIKHFLDKLTGVDLHEPYLIHYGLKRIFDRISTTPKSIG